MALFILQGIYNFLVYFFTDLKSNTPPFRLAFPKEEGRFVLTGVGNLGSRAVPWASLSPVEKAPTLKQPLCFPLGKSV